MYPGVVNPTRDDLRDLIKMALEEDCPVGDVSTDAVVPPGARSIFTIHVKSPCVACGVEIAAAFFRELDPAFKVLGQACDGDSLMAGAVFLKGEGLTKAILTAERSALNIAGRLSGIATQTRDYVARVEGTGVRILDTRKTTPGLRLFEKYAVRVGRGFNHRFGLSDMVLMKENHLAITARKGDDHIELAVRLAREKYPALKIEVEAANPAEAARVAAADADGVLLDNMTPEAVLESVAVVNKRCVIEVSGGITLTNIREYALPGVDYISVGALTHSVTVTDLSLLLEEVS